MYLNAGLYLSETNIPQMQTYIALQYGLVKVTFHLEFFQCISEGPSCHLNIEKAEHLEYRHTRTWNAWCKEYGNTLTMDIILKCMASGASKMLPLQNLDEQWENGRMVRVSCTCMWVCASRKATDWLTHLEWEELHPEVMWHTDDIMEKPKDFPKVYKKATWVARSTRTTHAMASEVFLSVFHACFDAHYDMSNESCLR